MAGGAWNFPAGKPAQCIRGLAYTLQDGFVWEFKMRSARHLLWLLGLMCALSAAAQSVRDDSPVAPAVETDAPRDLGPLPDFRLLDQSGRSHTIKRYVDAYAVAIMAAPKEDPELASRMAEFAALAKRYTPERIYFFVVTPSARPGDLPQHAGEVPVLLDNAQVVLPALGLDHAYECVLAETSKWRVLFRGDLSGDGAGVRGLGDQLAAWQERKLEPLLTAPRGPKLELQPAPTAISYARDVAPILINKCAGCHSEGNVGPFSMDNHKKVSGWADMMAETVRGGRMPPWQADPGFGVFSNAMGLSVQEKRTLLAWLESGAPKDGEEDPLASFRPGTPKEWRLGTPDVVVSLPEPQRIPAEGVLDYIYYEVPLNLPEGTWLQGTEIRITAPEVMHHVLVYMRRPGEDIDFTQEYIASYVPGHDPGFFPEGTGKPVPRDAQLLFQLHYTPNGKAVVDTPELGLYLSKTPPTHEIFLGSAVNRYFEIPPFEPEQEVEASFTAPADIIVYSLAPHMHYRGRRMFFEAHYPSGESEVLLSVPDYDFLWQHSYHLARPKRIPKDTVIRVAGAFDNSVRNPLNPDPSQRLGWGDQSDEEMFIGSVLYRVAD